MYLCAYMCRYMHICMHVYAHTYKGMYTLFTRAVQKKPSHKCSIFHITWLEILSRQPSYVHIYVHTYTHVHKHTHTYNYKRLWNLYYIIYIMIYLSLIYFCNINNNYHLLSYCKQLPDTILGILQTLS